MICTRALRFDFAARGATLGPAAPHGLEARSPAAYHQVALNTTRDGALTGALSGAVADGVFCEPAHRAPATQLNFADVDVPQGGVLLLSGNSGTGKSTWLALACGLRTASAGELSVAGQSLGALSARQRDAWRAETIGCLPQHLHLSGALTVRANLGLVFYAAGRREDATAIANALGAVGLLELQHRYPHELSVGQAQRVALARAVLLSPRVLLADEPSASLDDAASERAIALLLETARRCNATLVIATHDARVCRALESAQVQVQILNLNSK